MRPLDFYDLGVRLAALEGEAEQRTAVSRLYYGLHLEAGCRYFRENPDAPPIPRNRRHFALQDCFRYSGALQGSTIVELLGRLAMMRGECDYRIGSPLWYEGRTAALAELLNRALTAAADLRATLDAYSPSGAEYRVTGV